MWKITLPNEIIANYNVHQFNFGAFSNIYLVESLHNKNFYILKFLPRTLPPDRILTEIKILHRLRFENDVHCQLLKIYKTDDHYFLKLNYVENERIQHMFHWREIDLRIFMNKSLRALACLFEHGIIHWDIKLPNILYHSTLGQFSLIDFGLSREAQYRGSLFEMLRHREQVEKMDKLKLSGRRPFDIGLFNIYEFENTGTVGFRAPELIIENYLISDRIDVWSLGNIFLCILSGKMTFYRGNWIFKDLQSLFPTIHTQSQSQSHLQTQLKSQFQIEQSTTNNQKQPFFVNQSFKDNCDSIKDSNVVDIYELHEIYGSDRVVAWLRSNIATSRLAKSYLEKVSKLKYKPPQSLKTICYEQNKMSPVLRSKLIPDSLWDLLDKMLELDATKRPSAPQLLQHPFFQQQHEV